MSIIKTEIWEQDPEMEGCLRYVKQRKASEVFAELEDFLKKEHLYPDEYFLLSRDYNNPDCDFPKFDDMMCYAQWGGSEGIYLEVELFLYDEQTQTSHRSVFASGKSLGESTEDFERMQYIAAQIYMAFMGYRFQSGRFTVVDSSHIKNRKMLLEKVNFEFKDYINHKLLREKLAPSEIAGEIGIRALILDAITNPDINDDKVERLIKTQNVLSQYCELCKATLEASRYEIEEIVLSELTQNAVET